MNNTPKTNTGHGHVWERPDGRKARCGGPGICAECSRDAAATKNKTDGLEGVGTVTLSPHQGTQVGWIPSYKPEHNDQLVTLASAQAAVDVEREANLAWMQHGVKQKHRIEQLEAALAAQAKQPDAKTIALVQQCKAAFAEELAAYDIKPPIHHLQQGHDDCEAWLTAHGNGGAL